MSARRRRRAKHEDKENGFFCVWMCILIKCSTEILIIQRQTSCKIRLHVWGAQRVAGKLKIMFWEFSDLEQQQKSTEFELKFAENLSDNLENWGIAYFKLKGFFT